MTPNPFEQQQFGTAGVEGVKASGHCTCKQPKTCEIFPCWWSLGL